MGLRRGLRDNPRMDADRQPPSPLPLFPLQTVLFPEGVLPLRIFEVRYLDMIARCHREGACFGVVGLTSGSEVLKPADPASAQGGAYAQEAFHDIGTLARIESLERPQSGLMLIRCVGTGRFRLRSREQLRHGLWTGQAEWLPPDPRVPVPEDLEPVTLTLREVVRHLAARGPEKGAMPLQEPYRWDDCGWVSNRWAELLPVETRIKQQLMALDSPLLRLELVADQIERLRREGPPSER